MNTKNKGVQDALKMAHGWENQLADFFAKFPHVPEGGRKVIAQILPWLALVFGILGIIAAVAGGLITSIFSIPALLTGNIGGFVMLIAVIVSFTAATLEVLAFKPLQAGMKKGWNFLYYALLLGVVSALISILGNTLNGSVYGMAVIVPPLIGGVIGFIIGIWILFEVRGHFTK